MVHETDKKRNRINNNFHNYKNINLLENSSSDIINDDIDVDDYNNNDLIKKQQIGGSPIKYPKENDPDFYAKITKIYKNYKINYVGRTNKEICFPSKFTLQLPQKFAAEYINPKTKYKNLLIYARIGSGKSCTSIQIGEIWKLKRRIVIVLPAFLKDNYRDELRSACSGETYISNSDRDRLSKLKPSNKEYKEIIRKSNEKIDKYYTILSYNKFIEKCEKNKMKLNNSVLIIDEIQNMISEHGKYYSILYDAIRKAPDDLRVVIMSATPIFDKPPEIALTMNLLRLEKDLPTGNDFMQTFTEVKIKNGKRTIVPKNLDLFKKMIKGRVSYFKGAPSVAFPELKLKIIKCKLEDFQYRAYITALSQELKETPKSVSNKIFKEGDIIDLPNNFFIGTRIISNITFPNMYTGEKGFLSFDKKTISNPKKLKKYSIKFYKILKKIKRCKGTVFVYSNFKEYGGIKSFEKVLQVYGYKNYKNSGEGKGRYAIWSSDESNEYKDEIRKVFNKKDNSNGNTLKILLGSPSVREGISLLRVKQVHVLEPYWNWSRMYQVLGRAVRFCSHKDVPKDEQFVDVYIYLTSHPNIEITVDQYIQNLADSKKILNTFFEHALKESSIDCELNKLANQSVNEPLTCAR